jgi:hypothetical protein
LLACLREHRGTGREQLEQALRAGTGSLTSPPPELAAFMRSVDQLPPVIDMACVEEGARCLRRIGAITITGFGMAAGFYLGAILPGPARALADSARTVQHTTRRLSATARFVLGTFAPGGYARFGDGCKNATRLRLTHAAIRARLHQHGSWDTAVYGAPLSQADTLRAALTFNVIPALAAARLGSASPGTSKTASPTLPPAPPTGKACPPACSPSPSTSSAPSSTSCSVPPAPTPTPRPPAWSCTPW